MTPEGVEQLEQAINNQHQNSQLGKDFAHEIIQFSIFSNDDSLFHTLAGPMIGNLSALGSYKGDVYSTRMGIDDMNSDLDANNIYNRFNFNSGKKEDLLRTFTEYNMSVLQGDTNRAQEFLSNMGDGDIEAGLEKLKKELDHVDIGAQYIAQGKKSIIQDAFMADALINSYAFSADPDIYNKVSNQGNIENADQGGPTVGETKQAFLDYIEAELKR